MIRPLHAREEGDARRQEPGKGKAVWRRQEMREYEVFLLWARQQQKSKDIIIIIIIIIFNSSHLCTEIKHLKNAY